MIALAIIMLLIAAAVVVGIVATGTSQQVVFESSVGNLSTQPIWIFLAGVVATLLALLGISLLGAGTRRRVGRRREMRRLRRVEKDRVEQERATSEPTARDERPAHEGYDTPDRRLVRGPSTTTSYDPGAARDGSAYESSQDGGRPEAGPAGTTTTSGPPLDEPARHRQA